MLPPKRPPNNSHPLCLLAGCRPRLLRPHIQVADALLFLVTRTIFQCRQDPPDREHLRQVFLFSGKTSHIAKTSFIAITLIELPSALVLILLMDIWGRKPLMVRIKTWLDLQICIQVAALILPGASCIAAGWLEKVSRKKPLKYETPRPNY